MKLFHFSEEPDIAIFKPRQLEYRLNEPAMVWVVDEFHAPHYFLPRDCPRVCIWPQADTTEEDRQQFFGHSKTNHIIAVTPSLLPLRDAILASTVNFSMIRMKYANQY